MKIEGLRDGFNLDDSMLLAGFKKMQAEIDELRERVRQLAVIAERERFLADGYLGCGRG